MLAYIVGEQTSEWEDNNYEESKLIQRKIVRAKQHKNTIVCIEGQLAITLTDKNVLLCKIQLQQTHKHMSALILKHCALLINLTMTF